MNYPHDATTAFLGTKECRTCFETKDISAFYKSPLGRDGYFNGCKACMIKKTMKHAKTPAGARVHLRAARRHVEKNRERYRVHWREQSKKSLLSRPLAHRAGWAVRTEIRGGRLPEARNCPCTSCGCQASQYHHFRGYEKQFWLSVIPLCVSCHSAV